MLIKNELRGQEGLGEETPGKAAPSKITLKDNMSIFGQNRIMSLSGDHLANLQPNYFANNGIGRKSKFASRFNTRKQGRRSRLSCSSQESDCLHVPLSPVASDQDSERIYKFRDFFRGDAPIILEKQKIKNQKGPYKFSFKNIFSPQRNLLGNEDSLDEFLGDSHMKLSVDSRAKQSMFVYDSAEAVLKNGQHNSGPEDCPFVKFFFEVSNSDIVSNMERFLSKYLSLSKKHKQTFSRSTIRRKSLRSVLSILHHSETARDDSACGGKPSHFGADRGFLRPRDKQKQFRLKLLKKEFRTRNSRGGLVSRSLDLNKLRKSGYFRSVLRGKIVSGSEVFSENLSLFGRRNSDQRLIRSFGSIQMKYTKCKKFRRFGQKSKFGGIEWSEDEAMENELGEHVFEETFDRKLNFIETFQRGQTFI